MLHEGMNKQPFLTKNPNTVMTKILGMRALHMVHRHMTKEVSTIFMLLLFRRFTCSLLVPFFTFVMFHF